MKVHTGALLAVCMTLCATAQARVTRIVIDEIRPMAAPAGAAAPAIAYEQVAGRAFGELDPRLPVNAALASVVGLPSLSTAQPSGIGLPSLAYTMILPRVTSVSDKSTTIGSAFLRGITAAIGLVPKNARLPPHALIADGELVNAMPTMPASAMGVRCQASAPM